MMETQSLKTNKTIWRAMAAVAGAGALLIAGAAQAALQDRDLDGDTVVDAFYDTDLDITWLRDADVNGQRIGWDFANAWAAGFSIGGYDDWRPPISDDCIGYDCTGSEMGHLWCVELGNAAGSMTNTGSFQNLRSDLYWSGEYAPDPLWAWFFSISAGGQGVIPKGNGGWCAMAVRPGDVAAVPEPATYALMLAGLVTLALARRQRPH